MEKLMVVTLIMAPNPALELDNRLPLVDCL